MSMHIYVVYMLFNLPPHVDASCNIDKVGIRIP